MSTVRCKFRCDSKRTFISNNKTLYDYIFSAVYGGSNDASDENKKFWEWTPSGQFNVSTVKDGQFEPGKEYYLDIIAVE